MKHNVKNSMLLYAVTPDDLSLKKIESALQAGVTCLQLRCKTADHAAMAALGAQIKPLCQKYNVPLIINDDVLAAKEIGADGVHLGQGDMGPVEARRILGPNAIIGVTVKTEQQAKDAVLAGADYLGCGAAFPTGTKQDTYVIHHDVYKQVCSVGIPVVAIGGIDSQNVLSLSGLGLSGIAVVNAIFGSENVDAQVRQLRVKAKAITQIPAVLSIAGSDCSGGAGIQADLKTMQANGAYGMCAITALTAQNTCGVSDIVGVTPAFLNAQLDSIFTDIFPLAVKIGMVADPLLIGAIADKLQQYGAQNIVVDPVMVATSGADLSNSDSVAALKQLLLPLADLITPNIPEAEVLTGRSIRDSADMEAAAKQIYDTFGCSVLVKGGHSINDANDYLYTQGSGMWIRGKRVQNSNTHGTGCTLSSAIATNLAKGCDLPTAVLRAKQYITQALMQYLDLGEGSGPLHHGIVFESEQ